MSDATERYPDDDPLDHDCPECDGTGEVTCWRCDGSGCRCCEDGCVDCPACVDGWFTDDN